MKTHRSAYYSRNDSFSRSYNAEVAESEGRLPRTRAAAKLGVSVKAFDAGCDAAGYRATEWHHVGKYATPVDYYDTEELRSTSAFWRGAAGAYKTKATVAELLQLAAGCTDGERNERIEAFREKLVHQRDCSRPVLHHSTRHHFTDFVKSFSQEARKGLPDPWRMSNLGGERGAIRERQYFNVYSEVESAERGEKILSRAEIERLMARFVRAGEAVARGNARGVARLSRIGATLNPQSGQYHLGGANFRYSSHRGWFFINNAKSVLGCFPFTTAVQTPGCQHWGAAQSLVRVKDLYRAMLRHLAGKEVRRTLVA